MQYQITEQVSRRQWEQEQQSIIDDMRQRAQHDLEAQNPASTVTIDKVEHTIRSRTPAVADNEGAETYLVDFVFQYTISGQPNTFAA